MQDVMGSIDCLYTRVSVRMVTRSVWSGMELGSAFRCIRIGSSINEEMPDFDLPFS
jgi:hypothetical protein